MLSLVIFLLILGGIIFVHELGHFIAAKRHGVLVKMFCIGFKPFLRYKPRNSETTYAIGLIPLGGYVNLLQDNDIIDHPNGLADRTLESKTAAQKISIFFAGAFANIIYAATIFTFLYAVGFNVISPILSQNSLISVDQGISVRKIDLAGPIRTPAALPSIGDSIVEVNGQQVRNLDDFLNHSRGQDDRFTLFNPQRGYYSHSSRAADIKIRGEHVQTSLLAAPLVGSYQAIRLGFVNYISQPVAIFQMFTHPKNNKASGPIGIFQIVRHFVGDWMLLLQLVALLSIAIACLNLLPIFPFDGGHIFLTIVKRFTKPNRVVDNVFAISGLAIGVLLFIFAILSDILRLF